MSAMEAVKWTATPESARVLTDRIIEQAEGLNELIQIAYQSRAWAALGYAHWEDYCEKEFRARGVAIPRAEQAATVTQLRKAGMSLRAIESATGISTRTTRRLVSGVANATPDQSSAEPEQFVPQPVPKVVGMDGKEYKPKTKRNAPRPKLPPVFRKRVLTLSTAVSSLTHACKDDRFRDNADQIAMANLSDLIRARDALQRIIDQLPQG